MAFTADQVKEIKTLINADVTSRNARTKIYDRFPQGQDGFEGEMRISQDKYGVTTFSSFANKQWHHMEFDMATFDSKPWYQQVAEGLIPGYSIVRKFGSAAVTTVLSPIASARVYQTPTAAASLEFVSSSAVDAVNQAGAREFTFTGLDANWVEQTVVVAAHATNGTTAVAIPGTWMRLYRWYVSKSGSYATSIVGSHTGTLTVRVAGGGATWSTIGVTPFALGQSEIGVYTIPLGKTAWVLSKRVNVEGTKPADIYFFQRPFANDVSASYTGTMRLVEHDVGVVGPLVGDFVTPGSSFVGPCDIGFLGKVASSTAECSVDFELLLKNT